MKANSVSSVLKYFSSQQKKNFQARSIVGITRFLPSQVCLITEGTARLLSVSEQKSPLFISLLPATLQGHVRYREYQ